MRSVLHVGLDAVSHSKEGLRKGFLAAGFTEYHFFNWQTVQLNEGILGCQARMIQAAKNILPDLIFIQIQLPGILDEETVTELSKCGFAVNYTFDVRDAERTEWMYELAPYFGLTLFACKEDADEARRRGINNVGNIHSSCDPDLYRPLEVPCDCSCHKDHGPGNYMNHIVACCEGGVLKGEKRRQRLQSKYGYPDIVFIGNNYERTNLGFEKSKEREEMVNFMKKEFGDRFGTFGMNWGAQSRIINPDEEVRIYNSAKIVICHNNFYRTGYASDRQWRSMACGAAVVFHSYPGFEKDEESSDHPAWRHTSHLLSICDELLHNERWRVQVGAECRIDFLQRHTWKHRIESIKSMIHEQRAAASNPL